MNRFSFKFLGWAFVASVLFFSCEKTEEGGVELVPQKTVKCLVVNQGNYSDANGGIVMGRLLIKFIKMLMENLWQLLLSLLLIVVIHGH